MKHIVLFSILVASMFVGSESHYQFCTKSEDCAPDGFCGGVPLFQICLPYRKEGQSCTLLTCAPGLTCSSSVLDSGSSSDMNDICLKAKAQL